VAAPFNETLKKGLPFCFFPLATMEMDTIPAYFHAAFDVDSNRKINKESKKNIAVRSAIAKAYINLLQYELYHNPDGGPNRVLQLLPQRSTGFHKFWTPVVEARALQSCSC
jgi:hypothetical protein